MSLPAKINEEAYTKLSEEIKKEYKKQSDGTFLLDVLAVDGFAMEDVKGLKTALSSERTQREAAESKIKSFEGVDAAKAREALKKVEEMANWTPEDKVKEQTDAFKKQLEDKHRGELGKKDEVLTTLTKQLEKVMIDAEAIKAITENKGSATLLLPHVRNSTRMKQTEKGDYVVEIYNNDGSTRISPIAGSTAPMTISEFVAEMKSNETFAPAFDGTGATGTGAATSTSTSKGKTTLEELAKLPPAERMKRAKELGIQK